MPDTEPLAHGATVFIVDDDASIRRALSRLFASVGLRSEAFEGAADFLARAPRDSRGCIVLDIKMPDVTGIDLQRRLIEDGIDLPIIFVTAHADVPLAVRAIKDGAMEMFTKPFDDQALLDAVYKALERDTENYRARLEWSVLRKRYDTLTARQRSVMDLVVLGHPNKQIADTLGTSIKTIKVHRAHVMQRMGADSLAELVRMAVRLSTGPRA
jgi:FixJ family two-component response regulator